MTRGRETTGERVTHFLDALPFDFESAESRDFVAALKSAYPERDGVKRIAQRAGVRLDQIEWNRSAADLWPDIVLALSRAGQLRSLMRRVIEDPGVAGYRTTFERLLEAPMEEHEEALMRLLSSMYWEPAATQGVLIAVDVPIEGIDWNRPMREVWRQIIVVAHQRNQLLRLTNSVLADESVTAYHGMLRDLMKARVLTRVELARIADSLSGTFGDSSEIVLLAQEVKIPLHHVYWEQGVFYVWREIVEVARRENRLLALLRAAERQGAARLDPLAIELLGAKPANGGGLE